MNKLEPHILGRLVVMPDAFPASATSEVEALDLQVTELKSEVEAGKMVLAEWLAAKPTPRVMAMLADREVQLDRLENDLAQATKRLEAARPVISSDDHLATIRALRADCEAGQYDARLKVRTALRGLLKGIYCDTVEKVCLVVLERGWKIYIHMKIGASFDSIGGDLRMMIAGDDALNPSGKVTYRGE